MPGVYSTVMLGYNEQLGTWQNSSLQLGYVITGLIYVLNHHLGPKSLLVLTEFHCTCKEWHILFECFTFCWNLGYTFSGFVSQLESTLEELLYGVVRQPFTGNTTLKYSWMESSFKKLPLKKIMAYHVCQGSWPS